MIKNFSAALARKRKDLDVIETCYCQHISQSLCSEHKAGKQYSTWRGSLDLLPKWKRLQDQHCSHWGCTGLDVQSSLPLTLKQLCVELPSF